MITPIPFHEQEREQRRRDEEEGIRATVTVEVVSEERREGEEVRQERWKMVRGHSREGSAARARKEKEVLGMQ